MSRGIGGFANLVIENQNSFLYEYGAYNSNESEYKNEEYIYAGTIIINRDCFAELEVHEKVKKFPSGRKKRVTKKVLVPVDYAPMIRDRRIIIENCNNCWDCFRYSKVDVMAIRLLLTVLTQYQKEGKIPETVRLSF